MALAINHNAMALRSANSLSGHFANLSISTRNLSTGLRIVGAADDAAGLAIRELMRAEIAALNQGIRNANDAISLVQTADGALAVIDAQLIRMKELAEQAATGTYNSVQRLMIDSEYQQIADEISRIANATDFNGIKLLDGSLDPIAPIAIAGSPLDILNEDFTQTWHGSSVAGIGGKLFEIHPTTGNYYIPATRLQQLQLEASGEKYVKTGTAGNLNPRDYDYVAWQNAAVDIMNALNSLVPDGKQYRDVTTAETAAVDKNLTLDVINPVVSGTVDITQAEINAYLANAEEEIKKRGLLIHFGSMNDSAEDYYQIHVGTVTAQALGVGDDSLNDAGNHIKTQDAAGESLEAITDAIISKDKVRAYLGSMHNRLQATVDNLTIQSENTATSESRISDADVAQEMTDFTRTQILTQSAVAMLSQANSFPRMALNLLS